MEWTRETPESPKTKPSQWIWYWDDNDTEPMVMDLWPDRSVNHKQGWWATTFIERPSDPRNLKKTTKKPKEQAPPPPNPPPVRIINEDKKTAPPPPPTPPINIIKDGSSKPAEKKNPENKGLFAFSSK